MDRLEVVVDQSKDMSCAAPGVMSSLPSSTEVMSSLPSSEAPEADLLTSAGQTEAACSPGTLKRGRKIVDWLGIDSKCSTSEMTAERDEIMKRYRYGLVK